jgi:Domain of unknown function (DUF4160)
MPEVARIDGIRIMFYNDEHPPPHFHAQYGEYFALIGLDDLEIIAGWLPKAQYRKVRQWAEPRGVALRLAWNLSQQDRNPGKIP